MKHRGFTLIELLVVIAIIAILAAILFPVFAQAKAAAKKTQDLSNQKQIVLGMIMYTSDADDYLPQLQYFANWGQANQAQYSWHELVYPYIKSGNKSGDGQRNDAVKGVGGLWSAPDFPRPDQPGGSYAVSVDLFRDEWYNSGPGPGSNVMIRTFSLTSIDKGTDKVLVMHRGKDGGDWNWLQYSSWEWDWVDWLGPDANGNPTNMNPARNDLAAGTGDCDRVVASGNGPNWAGCGMHPRYRYNRVTNVALMDGHAKGFSRTATGSQLSYFKNIYVPEAYPFGNLY